MPNPRSQFAHLIVFLLCPLVLSGCIYVGDWSKEHHLRLSERFRLLAHHCIIDGNFKQAESLYLQSLDEQERAQSDPISRLSLLLEVADANFLGGNPDQALKKYQAVEDEAERLRQIQSAPQSKQKGAGGSDIQPLSIPALQQLRADAITGEGFSLLQKGEAKQAEGKFRAAQEICKTIKKTAELHLFPLDLCCDCGKWGLSLAQESNSRKGKQASDASGLLERIDDTCPTSCASSRMLISRRLFQSAGGTASGAGKAAPAVSKDEAKLQSTWESLMRGGQRSIAEKDQGKAERYYRKALQLLDQKNDRSGRLQMTLQRLSFMIVRQGRDGEALLLFAREVELKRDRFGKNSSALAAPLCRLGILQVRQNQLGAAEQTLADARSIATRAYGPNSEVCAIAYANTGELRMAQHRNTEAIEYIDKALPFFIKDTDKYRLRICALYLNRGAACMSMNDNDEALKSFARAEELIDYSVPLGMQVHILAPMCDIYFQKKDYKSCKSVLLKAQTALATLLEGGNVPPHKRTVFEGVKKHLQDIQSLLK